MSDHRLYNIPHNSQLPYFYRSVDDHCETFAKIHNTLPVWIEMAFFSLSITPMRIFDTSFSFNNFFRFVIGFFIHLCTMSRNYRKK